MLDYIRRYAHDIITVDDGEALAGMGDLIRHTYNLAEGSGKLAWASSKKYHRDRQG